MKVVDVGSGSPLVLVPGIQGRWEWMKPAVDALAAKCRVITFSLADEPSCGGAFDESTGFECYIRQIDDAMNAAGIQTATVCGVSYGGLIAAAFAVRHPERVSSLVLVSAIPPTWMPDARARFFLRAPRLLMPLFMVNSLRMYREIAAAAGSWSGAMREARRQAVTVLTNMSSPVRMARRATMLGGLSLEREIGETNVPTLVITGEPALDRVVPVDTTREYVSMWPHAEHVTLERTGHLGLITRAGEFARIVSSFVERTSAGQTRGLKPARYETTDEIARRAGASAPANNRRRIV